VSPRAGLDIVGKRKVLPCQDSDPYHPALNLVTILIELFWLMMYKGKTTKGEGINKKFNSEIGCQINR
jgi:hypothetical protein